MQLWNCGLHERAVAPWLLPRSLIALPNPCASSDKTCDRWIASYEVCNRPRHSASVKEAVTRGRSLDDQGTVPDARTNAYPMLERKLGARTPVGVRVRLETGKRRVIRLELEPEVERSLDVCQDADDGGPVRVVRPRGVAAQNAHGIAKVGASLEHGVHDGTDGLEVAGAEGRGRLVVLRSDSKLQVSLEASDLVRW